MDYKSQVAGGSHIIVLVMSYPDAREWTADTVIAVFWV